MNEPPITTTVSLPASTPPQTIGLRPIAQLAEALAKAQGEILPAPKDSDNPEFHSRYASLPAVREAVREAFARHGLSVIQKPEVRNGQLSLATILLHASGEYIHCGELAADVDLENPQKVGSAITYFRRYALAAISQTVADEDDDANAASQKSTRLSAKDTKQIENAKRDIAKATSISQLNKIGEALRDYSPAVQTVMRPVWGARSRELKAQETENADSRSANTTDHS